MVDKKFIVTKHNDLIEASYKLNLEEQRLLLLCISKIDSRSDIPDQVTVTASEYSKSYGIQLKHAYEKINIAKDRLYERDIKLKNAKTSERIRWVYHVIYHKDEGSVTLFFSPSIKPYLGQLNGMFQSYNLKNVSSLKSVHSIRLYELLNQWKSSKQRFIAVDDFKEMLQLYDKYERYSDLRKWVIEPSIKELNKKTNFTVVYHPKKSGKKVISLEFHFSLDAK